MSAIIARLIVSIVFMLGTPVLYCLLMFFAFEVADMRDEVVVISLVSLVTALLAVAGWIGLWHQQVEWTAGRKRHTGGLIAALTLVGALVTDVIMEAADYNGLEIGLVIAGMVWALGWFGLTPLIWKETAQERRMRIRAVNDDKGLPCPVCNYNLTGLREARCPECGASFTLDELYSVLTENQQELESPDEFDRPMRH